MFIRIRIDNIWTHNPSLCHRHRLDGVINRCGFVYLPWSRETYIQSSAIARTWITLLSRLEIIRSLNSGNLSCECRERRKRRR